MALALEDRIQRLSTVSSNRVIEPDTDVPGSVGPGPVLPKELLTVAGLGIDLSDEQWERLSREEVGAIVDGGIRFEAILMAGFGYQMANRETLLDPRVLYELHELGEETRHSRLFQRLLTDLAPTAEDPFRSGVTGWIRRFVMFHVIRHPALFVVLVLTGEEIPDLLQKLASEHPETDPFIRAVNRYHRAEEARHLAYGRIVLPELVAKGVPLRTGVDPARGAGADAVHVRRSRPPGRLPDGGTTCLEDVEGSAALAGASRHAP